MQNEMTQDTGESPRLPGHAIRALSATQRWARFAGTAMFGVALLKVIVATIKFPQYRARLMADAAMHGNSTAGMTIYILSEALTIICYCLVGWFALRYALRLDRVRPPRQPEPEDIANALGAQHSYWRLQGILWIVGLGLILLGIVAGVAIGILYATHAHY